MGVIVDITTIITGLIAYVGGFTDDAVLLITLTVLLMSFRRGR